MKGVSVGAILSNYQRERVENVYFRFFHCIYECSCHRLNLVSLAYLWRREQRELLGDMVNSGIDAILIKTATIGLNKIDIGKSIIQLHSKLIKSESLYGCNPCGEGGEYETFTLDAPLYKKRIVMYFLKMMMIVEMTIRLFAMWRTEMLLFTSTCRRNGIWKRRRRVVRLK